MIWGGLFDGIAHKSFCTSIYDAHHHIWCQS